MLGLDREILPFSESAQDKKIRDFVAETFESLSLEDAFLDLLDAIGKGFAGCEIVWNVDGNKVVPADLKWIPQKRFTFTDSLIPKITDESGIGQEIPPFKIVYHRYKARSGYDTRAGVLRVCAWMYLFKNYSIKDWVAFMEVFGMPLRLGKYDTGASKDDKDALVAAIQALGSDAAGIISKNTEIEFVESIKGRFSDNPFKGLAEFCDKQMSKAILGQTATTEGTPGKLGNETARDKVRHDLLEADAVSLAKTVRVQLIRPIVGYNFGWDQFCPVFKFQCDEAEDLKMLSEVYKNLREINQPISAEHVSKRFKIPMPRKGETVLAGHFDGPGLNPP